MYFHDLLQHHINTELPLLYFFASVAQGNYHEFQNVLNFF